MKQNDKNVALLTGLVDSERDAIYATENERTGCPCCNAIAARRRHQRLIDLDAAVDWLAQNARKDP